MFRREFADDLTDPRRGFGMFTFVAATDVVGARLAMDGHFSCLRLPYSQSVGSPGKVDRLPIVEDIGYVETWVALAVWAVTFVAMLHHLVTTVGMGGRSGH